MSEVRKPAHRRWAGVFLALVVLSCGLAVSLAAYAAVKAGEDRYAAQTMDRFADDITRERPGPASWCRPPRPRRPRCSGSGAATVRPG